MVNRSKQTCDDRSVTSKVILAKEGIKKEWWPFWLKKVFLKQITSEQQLVNHARAVKVIAWLSDVEIED